MANKQDLIAKVAEATELTKKDSAAAVEAVFAAVADYLAAAESFLVNSVASATLAIKSCLFAMLMIPPI